MVVVSGAGLAFLDAVIRCHVQSDRVENRIKLRGGLCDLFLFHLSFISINRGKLGS